jgi:hypothetical protein
VRSAGNGLLGGFLVIAGVLAGCAGPGWPDERGVPVAASSAETNHAEDLFLETLTSRRAGTTLPMPAVAPQLQPKIRQIAEFMRQGILSAVGAEREALRWGAAAYHGDVEAWVLDCNKGAEMALPRTLLDRPTAVITYAAAHFHPRSLASVQCAIILVAAKGGEHVSMPEMASPQ